MEGIFLTWMQDKNARGVAFVGSTQSLFGPQRDAEFWTGPQTAASTEWGVPHFVWWAGIFSSTEPTTYPKYNHRASKKYWEVTQITGNSS